MKTIEEQVALALRQWAREVVRAEIGYDGNVYDWTSALSSRKFLTDREADLSPESRHRLQRELEELDKRFMSVTRQDVERVLPAHMEVGAEWYWSRVPSKLVPHAAGAWAAPK